jgi:hypothetical protein
MGEVCDGMLHWAAKTVKKTEQPATSGDENPKKLFLTVLFVEICCKNNLVHS